MSREDAGIETETNRERDFEVSSHRPKPGLEVGDEAKYRWDLPSRLVSGNSPDAALAPRRLNRRIVAFALESSRMFIVKVIVISFRAVGNGELWPIRAVINSGVLTSRGSLSPAIAPKVSGVKDEFDSNLKLSILLHPVMNIETFAGIRAAI